MLFPTATFAIFFLIVLPLSWLTMPWPHRWRPFIVVASYVFYSWWDWRFVFLLAGCTVWNQVLAVRIWRTPDRSRRKALLFLALAGDLGVLGYFKYYDFFVSSTDNMATVVGLDLPFSLKTIVLPVGISFFTFMAISYVVDAYRGDFQPTTLEKFAVYLSFFPHLVAGPIVRPGELIPQLETPRDPRRVDTSRAFYLIATGLFKKVVIANYLASSIVDQVFAAPGQHSSLEILIAVYAYAVQIYADFSGYTDIAIGIALLLGFSFPQNFDSPYAAVSVQDFWRRWHMTLSRWLRDYVYIPLGGNRRGNVATYRNLMLTMLIGGLWHGAAWTFVVWGGLHGAALAGERWWRERRGAPAPARDRVAALAGPDPHLPLRVPGLDLLPVGLVRVGLGHDRRPLHTVGPALAPRHERRPARARGRDRVAVPPCPRPTDPDGALLAAPRPRPGHRPRARADADERPRPGGCGTLHLLPVLMAERRLPQLPPLLDDETRTLEQAAPTGDEASPEKPRRRPRPDDEGPPRKLWSAGHALVVCVLALAIGLLLNAPGIHKSAYNKPAGWQRDVALAVTGPLAGVSGALLLDRPREGVQALVGRSGNDEIHTDLGLPAAAPVTTPLTPRRAEARGLVGADARQGRRAAQARLLAEEEAPHLDRWRLARDHARIRDRSGRRPEPRPRDRGLGGRPRRDGAHQTGRVQLVRRDPAPGEGAPAEGGRARVRWER